MAEEERRRYGDAATAPGSARGDAAFTRLVEDFQGPLFAQILRSVKDRGRAADLLQETFLRAYRALPRFSFEAGLRTWLGRIAHNLSIDESRRRRPAISLDAPRGERCGRLLDALRAPDGDPVAATLREEARQQVLRALESLPPLYAEIVQLRVYERLRYKDIAKITGAQPGALKQRMLKATKLLRTVLERGG